MLKLATWIALLAVGEGLGNASYAILLLKRARHQIDGGEAAVQAGKSNEFRAYFVSLSPKLFGSGVQR